MKKKKAKPPIKVDDILLKNRQLFLYESVKDYSTSKIIQAIIALDSLNNKPIYLWINSPGGSVSAGFALINVMQKVKSKIITIVNSEACSMASMIAIAGNERWITPNGVIMFHDMAGGIGGDYSLKVKDRAIFLEKYYKLLENHMKKHTKLSIKEIRKARIGELWLFADECLKKGVVDKIIKND